MTDHCSKNAQKLLVEGLNLLNQSIARLREFEKTQSSQSLKYKVVSIPNAVQKLAEVLDRIIMGIKR